MDVYRATTDYEPPQGCVGVIPLKEGDFFEVLESEDYRYHKDWWGVRRTGDNAIGYVPAKFIKFEETRPEDVLPDNYQEQREMYVRQLHEMERANETNLPDMELGDAPVSPDLDVPEPDYQDEEEAESQLSPQEESADGKKYKYKVILPSPDVGKYLGGDGKGGGEIKPKKPVNPVLQSKDHQKLHREMMMNQKLGIDVLHKKSELKQAFENRHLSQAKKAKEEEKKASKNEIQLKLEEQAEKLRLYEESQKSPTSKEKESEELSPTAKSPTSPKTAPKPSAKPAAKTDQNQNQSEFLRVHSKIIRNAPS